MKDPELKLQALLDGELPEAEAAEAANWAARDQDAALLLAELRQTRRNLAGFEAGIRVPDSREFYWSKIQREIERSEGPAAAAETPVSFAERLRRLFFPATALTAMAIIGLLAVARRGPMLGTSERVLSGGMETAMADPSTTIYRDFESGATLVWFSYPAENESATGRSDATIIQ